MRPAHAKKEELTNKVSQIINDSTATIIVDYKGLSVSQLTDLRIKLREMNGEMRIYKNNIARRAAEKSNQFDFAKNFNGPTALITTSEDGIATLKIVDNFKKENEKIELLAGIIEGEYNDQKQLSALAKLPSKIEMYGTLAAMLQSPIKNFALAIKEIANKKEE